ncbi:hypothetical protein DSL72_006035 [Monilinia vaccinii-corymbosi]|uniref:Zn(2)-C6 fungal-type domain-containing protein n=1 Tax=Monilinia vaccinii-corymbosi TaxID=61207 RepID=A0A8A3PHC9_9HELO|nr:hypothetical protein DSL72_006035 [Monilinia vaccinii-corymbosi]
MADNNKPSRTTIPHGNAFGPRPSKRRDHRRIRSTRACDKCKKSKTKCSGDQPCRVCIAIGLEHQCTYNSPYSRGLPPKILKNPARDSLYNHPSDTGRFSSIISNSFKRQEPRQILPKIGPNGEFLHETMTGSNGAVFQGGQQRFSIPVSSFGDLPMPNNRSAMIALPNSDAGARLVATYFNHVSPSMLFLHIPSIECWAADLLSDDGYMLQKDELRSRNAVILLVFASAQAYLSGSEVTGFDSSMRYFQLADEQLHLEVGPPQLASIQARLLQCQYLLARGRIHQCWSSFGNVVSLIYTLGIHRKYSQEGLVNLIDVECQKRVFWAAFTLDKYLSYALNERPQRIDLDNTDQDMPKFLDDRQLTPTFLMPVPKDTLSKNFASNLQTKLAIVISKILKDIYGVKKPTVKAHLELAKAYMVDLEMWKENAGPLIYADLDILTRNELYKLQRSELLLAYHHAYVLLLRNFMIQSSQIYSPSDAGDDEGISKDEIELEIDEICGKLVEACLFICEIIEVSERDSEKDKIELTETSGFRSAWFTHYIMYSAAAVIYLNGHQEVERVATQPECMILKKSLKLHKPLKAVAHTGTFIGKCVAVLDELKEALYEAIDQCQFGDPPAKNGTANGRAKHGNVNNNAKNGNARNGTAMTRSVDRGVESSGSGSEYGEDVDNVVIDISSDNGSDTLSGHGYRYEDTHMMDPQRNTKGVASDGRISIMERIYRWGYSRLTDQ